MSVTLTGPRLTFYIFFNLNMSIVFYYSQLLKNSQLVNA